MRWRLRSSDLADADLIDIWNYIAADNPTAADRQVTLLTDLFDTLAEFPEKGRPTPEISPDHRILRLGRYLLFYRLDHTRRFVELVRVIHGARDWRNLLEGG